MPHIGVTSKIKTPEKRQKCPQEKDKTKNSESYDAVNIGIQSIAQPPRSPYKHPKPAAP